MPLDRDRPGYADRRQRERPIPAEGELRLAHQHAPVAPPRQLVAARAVQYTIDGLEPDQEHVRLAGLQKVGHVESIGPEGVFGVGDLGRVQINVRVAVETVKAEVRHAAGRLVRRELQAIPPVPRRHPVALPRIVRDMRVRHPARGDQRRVHIAGHAHVQPARRNQTRRGHRNSVARARVRIDHHPSSIKTHLPQRPTSMRTRGIV